MKQAVPDQQSHVNMMTKDQNPSADRLLAALSFETSDRVPFDLAGTTVSAISSVAYRRLMEARELAGGVEPRPIDPIQQIVFPDAQALSELRVDTCRMGARRILDFEERLEETDGVQRIRDGYGCDWEMNPATDHYFNQVSSPLDDEDEELSDLLEDFRLYDVRAFADRMEADFREQAERVGDRGIVLDRNCAGLTEVSLRLRGYENWFMDTLEDEAGVAGLLDLLLEHKLAYWDLAIETVEKLGLSERVLVCAEADDLGTQTSLLIAPEKLRQLVFPRIAQLSTFIKKKLPQARFFFHSDGAIVPIIPDFIEAGVDILNPLQYSAQGMNLAELKSRFGRDVVLWGGGIDTQEVLNRASPAEVRDEVRRNLEILAPGGGYVFSTVHNIQSDVPPENFWAMWETLMDFQP